MPKFLAVCLDTSEEINMTTPLISPIRVPLDSNRLTQGFPTVQTLKDTSFHSQPSPYDVPVEMIGEYDAQNKRFSLKLNYIAEEPMVSEEIKPQVIIFSGKNSGRIYEVQIANFNARNFNAKSAIQLIEDGIDLFAQKKNSPVSERVEMAKRAIQEGDDQLEAELDCLLGADYVPRM
jgi:hypothetical protein